MFPHQSKFTKYFFVALFAIVLLYAYYEARNMLYGPQIELGVTSALTVHEQAIEVTGSVRNVVHITLSGNPVFIDDEGVFTETRLLSLGLNRLIFEAEDKFGRSTKEIIEVVYEPQDNTPAQPAHTEENLDTIEEYYH